MTNVFLSLLNIGVLDDFKEWEEELLFTVDETYLSTEKACERLRKFLFICEFIGLSFCKIEEWSGGWGCSTWTDW